MSFEIESDGLDVDEVLRLVRQRIAEKRDGGLFTEDELREVTRRGLEAVLEAGELRGDLIEEFRARDARWNYTFDAESIYRSTPGLVGRQLRRLRRLLQPVQKLFWNPGPMVSALSRQADLNRYQVHLLHNLVLELTRLNLQVQELRNRNLQLTGRLELLARREKTLEEELASFAKGGERGGTRGGE
jgi:hypothetical protein